MFDDDAELVALIDNELDESSRAALMARLAADEGLRERYEALRRTSAPIGAAFDALIAQAPLARLAAALPADEPLRQPPRRFALRALAAGVAIGILAAGAAAWAALSFGLIGPRDDWRSAVAEYVDLYTSETFSPMHPDAVLQAAEIGAVGAKVGAKLTPESIGLPGLRFAAAFMLSYEGSPLGVIAYVDPAGAPVLFCILAKPAPDAAVRSEQRGDLAIASWSRAGRRHLVIGRIPKEQAASLAQILEKRV